MCRKMRAQRRATHEPGIYIFRMPNFKKWVGNKWLV